MDKKVSMRIGELGQATGADIQTIRFYEKAGLLAPPPRSANGYRRYGPAHVERLAFIRHCRALDIPLSDIQDLLSALDDPRRDCTGVDQLVERQLQRVQARLSRSSVLL